MTGGGSQTVGLAEAIENSLACPVQFLDPFAKIKFPANLRQHKKAHKIISSVLVGLSLRSLE